MPLPRFIAVIDIGKTNAKVVLIDAETRSQVAARAASDLSPLDGSEVPEEVRPLVAELNDLFARLRDTLEAQRHFIADAAHELRSPLAALSLQLQYLRRAEDDAEREVAAGRLAAGIDRAARLVEQLLVLARQEASAAAGERTGRQCLVETAAGCEP